MMKAARSSLPPAEENWASSVSAESVETVSAVAAAAAAAGATAGGARYAVDGRLPLETLLGPLGRAGSSERGCRRQCARPTSSPRPLSARAGKRHL